MHCPTVVLVAPDTSADYRLAVLGELARQGSCAATVRAAADEVLAGSRDTVESVVRLVRFCRALPVVPNPPAQERFQDAVTTLALGGNCSAKCVLLAALLLCLRAERGVPLGVTLVWEHHPGTGADHTVVRLLVPGEGTLDLDPLREGARSSGGASQVEGAAL